MRPRGRGARGARAARPAGRARRGFTLIEVLMSIGIMSAVLIGMAAFVQQGQHNVATAALSSTASDLAVWRIETAKAQSSYTGIDSLAASESAIPRAAGFTRTTAVLRTNTAAGDYKTVTVTVTHPAMSSPVQKTVVIASF